MVPGSCPIDLSPVTRGTFPTPQQLQWAWRWRHKCRKSVLLKNVTTILNIHILLLAADHRSARSTVHSSTSFALYSINSVLDMRVHQRFFQSETCFSPTHLRFGSLSVDVDVECSALRRSLPSPSDSLRWWGSHLATTQHRPRRASTTALRSPRAARAAETALGKAGATMFAVAEKQWCN